MNNPSPFFDYDLPRELIAQQPLRNRTDARLMVVDRERQKIFHHHVRDLPDLLRATDTLALNNTKVIPAQLSGFRTTTGGRWKGLFLRADAQGHWHIVCKTRGKLSPGESVELADREGRPVAKLWLLERIEGGQWLAHVEGEHELEPLLNRVGRVPLPHYIRGGQMADSDVADYQTVFARRPGAVAAPTAGLHFTKDLLRKLEARGLGFAPITLHVGLGTFRPVTSESPEEHTMHFEWGELPPASARLLNERRTLGGRTVAVGTTSVRVLETAVQFGPEGRLPEEGWQGETDLFIYPPYNFRGIDALLTNFHFPRTTLLLLVQAFGGTQLIREAYAEAIHEQYRFYSYGDAMLIV